MNDDDRQAARFAVVNELRGINYRLSYWWNRLHPLDNPVVTGIDLDLLREQHVVVPTTTMMPVPSRQQLTAFLTACCNLSVAEVEQIQDMNEIVDILRREVEKRERKLSDRISPEKRTRPMSFKRAARLMGKGDSKDAAEWLSQCVQDGTFQCEHVSRQNHVFSIDDFPESVWPTIRPK